MSAALARHAAALLLAEDVGASVFPRDLERIATRTCPVAFIALENLSERGVDEYIARMGIGSRPLCSDRRLRGCIVADHGEAFVFYDPGDPADERRFTIAHEMAHYALDYELPRRRALAALGESILAVLDGDRAPTPEERIDASLAGTPLGSYVWLMERDEQGRIADAGIMNSESRADALALVLLAPASEVIRRLPHGRYGETERDLFQAEATAVLRDDFGLQKRVAETYARQLWPRVAQPDTRAWLGMA